MPWLNIDGLPIFKDPELIIFDKDGTLTDVHYYWTRMISLRADLIVKRLFKKNQQTNARSSLIDLMGIDLKTGRIKPEGPVGIKPRSFIEQIVTEKTNKMGARTDLETIKKIFRDIDNRVLPEVGKLMRPLPGVKTFLKKAKKLKIKMAVGTSDTTKKTKQAFRQIGIGSYFDFIVGGDLVGNSKPSPEMANAIMSQAKVRPTKAVVIGDHPVDIKMGLNAGIKCNIGILTGLGRKEDFRSYDCHIAESFKKIGIEND